MKTKIKNVKARQIITRLEKLNLTETEFINLKLKEFRKLKVRKR